MTLVHIAGYEKGYKKALLASTAMIGLLIPATTATAQDAVSEERRSATDILIEEILVTGTKKSRAENLQDVPTAISAYSSDQIDALKVRNLQNLAFNIPNVALDDIGTFKGTANFAIRGLGINSSIPSVDPTVGVFVDGVYLGVNLGVVFDTFDLEGVEILRGPQGLLFGRNVTGGAVVLRTKKPTDEFSVSAKAAVESGLKGTGETYIFSGSISGPIVEDKLKFKLAGYYNDDNGFFENLFDGSNIAQSKTEIFRPVLTWTPTENIDLTLRYEHGSLEGQGPASQNRGLFDRNSFDVSIDEPGLSDSTWDQFTAELNWDVDFGNGRITNIFGYRDLTVDAIVDVDATPNFLFHVGSITEQDQISNEIRYAGRFGDIVDISTGFYYFTQDVAYLESRAIPPTGLDFTGGGILDHETWGIFAQADIDLSEKLVLTLGGRYTEEDKEVQVATLLFNAQPTTGELIFPIPPGGCDVTGRVGGSCTFDFSVANGDDAASTFDAFTPKVGLKYEFNDTAQVYAHWSRGFRSGGYNFRNTSAVFDPGPFDQESLDNYEAGIKYQSDDRRITFNAAVFLNDIQNLQREINLPDPVAGVVQIIRNTADAEIFGIEAEGQFLVAENLLLTANIGILDGDYTEVRFDLTGDGVIDDQDLGLDLPRLANLSYGFGAVYDLDLGNAGAMTIRANFNHRDRSAFTDNNVGFINGADMLDAFIAWHLPDERFTISVYARNILNEVVNGGDTILPFFPGATFSPLNKGGVFGLELQFDL